MTTGQAWNQLQVSTVPSPPGTIHSHKLGRPDTSSHKPSKGLAFSEARRLRRKWRRLQISRDVTLGGCQPDPSKNLILSEMGQCSGQARGSKPWLAIRISEELLIQVPLADFICSYDTSS